MDSLNSLNRSLPRASSQQPASADLIQAFKSAALSVTNLYKSAAAEQSHARTLGYQDAIEELLTFLDNENLGLQDGEGWKIRRWATERFEPAAAVVNNDSEEEMEEDRREGSSSPVHPEQMPREQPQSQLQAQPPLVSSGNEVPESPLEPSTNVEINSSSPTGPRPFTFQAGQTIQIADVESSDPTRVKLQVIPRNRNGRLRDQSMNQRTNSRTSPPVSTSTKRKQHPGDFFDFEGLFDGNKRSRYT